MLARALRSLVVMLLSFVTPVFPVTAQPLDFAFPPQFDAAGTFSGGSAPVQLGRQWGVIDATGKWIHEPQYEAIVPLGQGRYALRRERAWEVVGGFLPPETGFEDVKRLSGAHFAAKRDGRWAIFHDFYSPAGGLFLFEKIGGSDGRFVTARDVAGWAVFEFAQNKVVRHGLPQSQYEPRIEIETAYPPNEDYFVAKTKDGEALFHISRGRPMLKWDENTFAQAIDESVEIIDVYLAKEARAFKRFSEGMAGISFAPGAWGFYQPSTRTVLWEGRFEDVREFSSGLAPVKIDGKWGYIDKRGREVVAPQYDRAYPFRDGIAIVRQDGLRGFLHVSDAVGLRTLFTPQFEDVYRFSEGLAPVKVGGLWGYIRSDAAIPSNRKDEIMRLQPPE